MAGPITWEPHDGPVDEGPEQVVVTAEMLEMTSPAVTEHRYVTDGVGMPDLEAWADRLTARLSQDET